MKDDGQSPPLEVKPRLMVEPEKEAAAEAAREKAAALGEKVANAAATARQVRRVVALIGVVLAALVMVIRLVAHSHRLVDYVMNAEECWSGRMLRTEGGRLLAVGGLCTKDCSDDAACGAGFRCHGGDCVPQATKKLGEDCSAPWDCEKYLCLKQTPLLGGLFGQGVGLDAAGELTETTSYCSQSCNSGDATSCPSGFLCDHVSGSDACVKDGAGLEDVLRRLGEAQGQEAQGQ
jgi:hypothetical protein